jgi:hypothetical protein
MLEHLLNTRMCKYYKYTVVYKECTKTLKHTKQKEKDV